MTDSLAERVEKLEATVAFQERALDELTQLLIDHWKQIEALRRDFNNLGAQVREVESHPALAGDLEPPPPHY